MAHLNCPGCQGQGMWTPWGGGLPVPHQLGPARMSPAAAEDWSDSDSDSRLQRERLQRFSTLSGRAPRRDDTRGYSLSGGGGCGRRRGSGRRPDWDTMSSRAPRPKDWDTMSLRTGRRSDLDSSPSRSQRRPGEPITRSARHRRQSESESSDERESDQDPVLPRSAKKVMSDMEHFQPNRRRSEPVSRVQSFKTNDSSLRKKNRRNETFTDTGRRRSSPVNHQHTKSSDDDDKQANGLSSDEARDTRAEAAKDKSEICDEEEELGPIPQTEWECKHCTFVNEGGTRVCAVCCKTTTRPKKREGQRAQERPWSLSKVPSPKAQSPKPPSTPAKLEEDLNKSLNLGTDNKPLKNVEKPDRMKEKRGRRRTISFWIGTKLYS